MAAKCSAKQRGLGFYFTFEEWVKWWEDNLGSDWMSLRGRRNGQYQMCRKGDVGPYAHWNVTCGTREENDNQVDKKGENHGRATITNEIALKIYKSKDLLSASIVAKTYGIRKSLVHHIRCGRSWTHITGVHRC